MISRLEDDKWAERGLLSLQRRVQHLCTRQGHCTGARVEGRVTRQRRLHVQVHCARIYTHTHSLNLPAKVERAGDVLSRRAHIHCARAHSLSIHSVWGGVGLQVLNVASRRTRTRIWRRIRKALSAYVMYWQMHIYGTMLHIYCISDILCIVSIYMASCLYLTSILYITYSPHIAYISYFVYFVCIFNYYIVHIVHIYA